MDLIKKLEIFLTIRFMQNTPREKKFREVLVREQAFLDNINIDLKTRPNWHFCKTDSP